MEKKDKDYSGIIFGYMDTPSYGCFGEDDGGFSVSIYPDGRLIYKTYIFDEIEKTKTEIRLLDGIVDEIKAVLEENQNDIDGFDYHIDNCSCDGDGNFFIFNGKRIITWNIDYCDEDELKKINPDYYKEYLPVVKQQNKMIIIFAKISEILEKQGIDLKIYEVNFSENS